MFTNSLLLREFWSTAGQVNALHILNAYFTSYVCVCLWRQTKLSNFILFTCYFLLQHVSAKESSLRSVTANAFIFSKISCWRYDADRNGQQQKGH